jgi:hypothetical protein
MPWEASDAIEALKLEKLDQLAGPPDGLLFFYSRKPGVQTELFLQ